MARAFHAQCNVTLSGRDWYIDLGIIDHLTTSIEIISNPTSPVGIASVTFENGQTLPISQNGHTTTSDTIRLCDVLVVLTSLKICYYSLNEQGIMVWKSYSLTCISIFKIAKKRVLARRCFEDDLYVLHTSHEALVASTHCNKASYEAWLSRLEHFSFDTIVTLQKLGNVSLTTILSFIGFILYTPSLSFIMPC